VSLRAAACIVLAAAALCIGAGCGGIASGTNPADNTHSLTIYSSLPLQGVDHARQQEIVNGEKLALHEVGGRVGRFHVSFVSLDDSDPTKGAWSPDITSQAARLATQDQRAIAYIGDFDSGATAVSLPLINEADILQVSPASTYVGLTSADPQDGKGEPDRYYPTGRRTFVRLMPSDEVQAAALVNYMRQLGVHRLFVLGDLDVFDSAIAATVALRAQAAGISVPGQLQVDTRSNVQPSDYAQTATSVAAEHPDAVLLGGAPGPGAQALWQALHAALPNVKLFAPNALATPSFVSGTGAAAKSTYVTSPVLQASSYPAEAQRVLQSYKATFGAPATVYALYGYEAMRATLAAIRAAGSHAASRLAVVRAFFKIRDRNSVLGRYSVLPSGDVSLSSYAGYRIDSAGRLRFDRLLS
jgi:branched-chain amino acid transport system substrate-binding protein